MRPMVFIQFGSEYINVEHIASVRTEGYDLTAVISLRGGREVRVEGWDAADVIEYITKTALAGLVRE